MAVVPIVGTGRVAKLRGIASAAAFVVLISACDETFQWILPYRFGDINDFLTNVLGGILGICLYLALNKPGHD